MNSTKMLTKEDAVPLLPRELNDNELLKQKIIDNLFCPYDLLKEYYVDPEPLKKEMYGVFGIGEEKSMIIHVTHYPYKKKGEKSWSIFGGHGTKFYKNIAPLLKHIDKYKSTMENWGKS